MKAAHPLLVNTVGLISSAAVKAWMSTLRYKAAFYDPTVDPVDPGYHGQKIYIFWHEYILFPLYLRGHCNLSVLISRHADADVLKRVALHMGIDVVRGSTTRGGAAALREMVACSRKMNLVITPDGPRGPRRRCAAGPIYLASRLGLPLVAMGLGYDRPWRVGSWDRFAVPRPGSRGRSVVSPPLSIPQDLDRAGIEHYRQRVDGLLGRLTQEAEAWAESGTRKQGEVTVTVDPPPRRPFLVSRPDRSDRPTLLPLTPRPTSAPPRRRAV